MTKAAQAKIKKGIIDFLKSKKNFQKSDEILIDELVDWLKISEYAKKKLEADPDAWMVLNQISMSSKAIQSLLTKLHCTPLERNRKLKVEIEKDSDFDLDKFLDNN